MRIIVSLLLTGYFLGLPFIIGFHAHSHQPTLSDSSKSGFAQVEAACDCCDHYDLLAATQQDNHWQAITPLITIDYKYSLIKSDLVTAFPYALRGPPIS